MNKKAEQRLRPFMDLRLSKNNFKKKVEDLSPQDLGEIKNLLLIKIQEIKDNIVNLKSKLEKSDCSQEFINHQMLRTKHNLTALKQRQDIFDNTFKKRRRKRLLKKMSVKF